MNTTATETGRLPFVRAICERPDDDAPRLVYADWLDEHGEPERAEFIRVQCKLARMEKDAGHRLAWDCKCPVCVASVAVRHRESHLWGHGFGGLGAPLGLDSIALHLVSPSESESVGLIRRGFVDSVWMRTFFFLPDERPCPNAEDARQCPETGALECCRECDYTGVIGGDGWAKEFFRDHPITAVRLVEKHPEYRADGYDREVWVWYRTHTDAAWVTTSEYAYVYPAHLPPELYDLIDRPDANGLNGESIAFASEADAYAALSLACVRYGRALAGLPVLPIPIRTEAAR